MDDPPDGDPAWEAGHDEHPLRPRDHANRRQPRFSRCAAGQLVRASIRRRHDSAIIHGRAESKMSASRTCVPNRISLPIPTRTMPGNSSPSKMRRTSGCAIPRRNTLAIQPSSAIRPQNGSRSTNAINLDPKSVVTGERRYTFDLSGQLDFVTDSQANSGRHDFVNNSTRPPGPHVFHNSVANNALNDSGPHQRWATGTLFDNITVHGDNINARNRGSFGTRMVGPAPTW